MAIIGIKLKWHHLNRNSWHHPTEIAGTIRTVVSKAELRMDDLEAKWDNKYHVVIDSWRRNWEKLTTYFRYDKAIRKLIYTTNTIEGFHRQVRKVTKTKGAFTSDMALLKLIYLAHRNIKKKWTIPLANWAVTAQKLAVWFPGRMVLDLQ